MKILKLTLCTFAAIWFPVVMLAGIFELDRLNTVLRMLGEWPFYVMIAGLIWMLIDLWQSPKTQDDKIWWTALGILLAPVVAPAYWFGYGLRRNRPAAGTDDGKAAETGPPA